MTNAASLSAMGKPDSSNTSRPAFISYSNADQAIAEALLAALEAAEIHCWIAPRDVKAGRPYSGQITQAIREAQVLVLILSTASNRSKHVLREVERAAHCQNHLLTFRIEPVAPADDLAYFLGADHWVDGFRPLPPSQHFPTLLEHLRALLQAAEAHPEVNEQPDAPVPETFGRFHLLRHPDGSLFRLGKGGMGVTYKASDTLLNRSVALKVITSELLRSSQARNRFLREAQSAALIQHPNVATIYDFGEEGDTYFYVMEFVEGEDLEHYVSRQGPLPPATALRVGLQVAQALEAAQARQLIHRDIKPANIMAVVNRAGLLDIKLIDFGLARGAGTDSFDAARITRTQDFIGSPAFASPEQCETKKLDIRSDIYSLGVTLWYLLSGKRPFSGSVGEVIIAQVVKPPPFDQLANTPESVVRLLRRMLEKKPEDRFQTPEELQQAIEEAASQLSPEFSAAPHRIVPEPPPMPSSPAAEDQIALAETTDSSSFDEYLEIQVGAVLANRYQLFAEAREGNGGRLFQARDEEARPATSTVAVKLLHPSIAGDPDLLALLENELEVIRQAPHPQLVRYYSLEQTPALVVREWIHGFLLYDVLRWRRSLTGAELVPLLDSLAATLDFVAAKGLGLVELSVRKLFVECPHSIQDFEALGKTDAREWSECVVKLNPLSLAPLLFRSRNGWDLKTIVPASRILSLTQVEAGIRGSKAVRLYGSLVYELLSGRAPVRNGDPRRLTPLPILGQPGNEILRRACVPDDAAYRSCHEFWSALKENLSAQPSRPAFPPSMVAAAPAIVATPLPADPPAPLPVMTGPSQTVAIRPPTKRFPRSIVAAAIVGAAVLIGLGIIAVIERVPGFYYQASVHDLNPAPKSVVSDIASPSPTSIGTTPTPFRAVTATPSSTPTAQLTLEKASKDDPWVNSLGMKFVPVPGTAVLFSIWDTRVQDYQVFIKQSDYDPGPWKDNGYNEHPMNPVTGASWNDAEAFCEWLTKREHASGLLRDQEIYRLPTDEEWSVAVGLEHESGETPAKKNGKIKVYPWGKQWPPPPGFGNYFGYGRMNISPVGTFPPNKFGLYDMGGNVWQWCADWYDETRKSKVLRGGDLFSDRAEFLSSFRNHAAPDSRGQFEDGFRCIIGLAN